MSPIRKNSRKFIGEGPNRRYSEAFKRKVVYDIEHGVYTAHAARLIYRIGGKMTVYKWLSQYGSIKDKASGGTSMKKNLDPTAAARIRELEALVADLSLEKKILETTIEIANEEYGVDLKKNFAKKLSEPSASKANAKSQ